MLFGYPVAATTDNWLHKCLSRILLRIHRSIRSGRVIPSWPTIIPATYRQRLETRTGLRDHLATYVTAIQSLNQAERDQVSTALINQNNIAGLLTCSSHCELITALPAIIQPAIKELYKYAYKELLKELGIRDRHYRIIYDRTRYHLCPFCGCEFFSAPRPDAPREELDHYLAVSKYPFAAVNLRNLTPMGHRCNSSYKHTDDILRDDNGTRRRSFDPYNAPGLKVQLEDSVPFAGQGGQIPRWVINFDMSCDEVETWDSVFSIRNRYEHDHLTPDFKPWLNEFRHFCRVINHRATNDQEVVRAVSLYTDFQDGLGFRDRAFLKVAVFKMLLHHCQNGNQRLIRLLKDLIA
ncbi:MAG TPA: hypothetical protein VHV83_02265 [Armatimonadota bacterium]|nr:hypothetical protein [Armatimonadota bacterium]